MSLFFAWFENDSEALSSYRKKSSLIFPLTVKLVVVHTANDEVLIGCSPHFAVKMLPKIWELIIIGKHMAEIESYLWVIIIHILYIASRRMFAKWKQTSPYLLQTTAQCISRKEGVRYGFELLPATWIMWPWASYLPYLRLIWTIRVVLCIQ